MGLGLKDQLLRASSARETAPDHMKSANRAVRVLLIQPPTVGGVRSLLPQVDDDGGEGIGYKPPLGILYVGSIIDAWSDHEVKVVDAQAEQLGFRDLVKIAEEWQPDVVGISAWTDFWYPAFWTGKLIKEVLPETHLTFGGPHLGIYPKETLDIEFTDSVIVGDGEIPFLYLCNMVANGKLDNSMPGLHIKEGGVKLGGDLFFIQGDLDELPKPNRRLLNIKNYSSVLGSNDFTTTMITSRGCPHRCTFCKLNFQKNVASTAENVVEEFRQIVALGIKEVEIYDDTFTWQKRRLDEICTGLIEADLGVTWAIRDRVSSKAADDETMALLYKAGCRRIHFGIESGVQRIIDIMKKRITLEQARNAVSCAKRAGMTVLTYFMFGNPDERVEDMEETLKFALSLDADFAQFSITIPYAGTEMYDQALADGLIEHDYWRDYASNPVSDFLPPKLIEEHADLKTLLAIRDKAVRQFYFRPRYIWRSFSELQSFGEFLRKARMGMQLAVSVYTK